MKYWRGTKTVFCANKPSFKSNTIRHVGADMYRDGERKGSDCRAKSDSHPFAHASGSIKPFYTKLYETLGCTPHL
jgi:hypothetical protein